MIKGHFKRVYEDIFRKSCDIAGYNAVRADQVKQTNLIHLDILQKLISAPMAICDLSNRNPNVLFELGLRQAFDKPTVLVQEVGTPQIFDISPMRYTSYRKELKYREVLEDQIFIADALRATKEATEKGEGVNSIVSLLSLKSPATLKEGGENDTNKMLQVLMSELSDLKSVVRRSVQPSLTTLDLDNKDKSDYIMLINRCTMLLNLIDNNADKKEAEWNYKNLIADYFRYDESDLTVLEKERLVKYIDRVSKAFEKKYKDN